jgi:hypothetical protein
MTPEHEPLTQTAPWPFELEDLIEKATYRPGWRLSLTHDRDRDYVDGELVGHGATLEVWARGIHNTNDVDAGAHYGVVHFFIVPAATYTRAAWARWLLDRLIDVETHEAMEFLRIDGEQPFPPHHGPGENPYVVVQAITDEQRRTRPDGRVVDH